MVEDCVFCKIIQGDIPAQVVYKDDATCAFLDANPLVEGHTLVVPVRHDARLTQMQPQSAAAHLGSLPRIVRAVVKVMQADGATVAWNDGPAAGQEVPHVHAHVVPRFDGDTHGAVHAMFTQAPRPPQGGNDPIARRLRQELE